MKTARGVYLNIYDSDYKVTLKGITFVFSSRFYRNKFVDDIGQELERFNKNANSIYKNKYCIVMDELALVRLYCLIEKRGFYIIVDGINITSPDQLKYVVKAVKVVNG